METETPHRLLKERQRRERAELILEAAEAVFAEKGYYETSIDEIAERVGVAKGTLYQHFASKEELVFVLFENQIEMIRQVVERVVASDLSARAKLEAILQHIYQGFMRKRTQLMLSLYESTQPVWLDESSGCWHVFRYADVHYVITDYSVFTSEMRQRVRALQPFTELSTTS